MGGHHHEEEGQQQEGHGLLLDGVELGGLLAHGHLGGLVALQDKVEEHNDDDGDEAAVEPDLQGPVHGGGLVNAVGDDQVLGDGAAVPVIGVVGAHQVAEGDGDGGQHRIDAGGGGHDEGEGAHDGGGGGAGAQAAHDGGDGGHGEGDQLGVAVDGVEELLAKHVHGAVLGGVVEEDRDGQQVEHDGGGPEGDDLGGLHAHDADTDEEGKAHADHAGVVAKFPAQENCDDDGRDTEPQCHIPLPLFLFLAGPGAPGPASLSDSLTGSGTCAR